MDRLISQMNPVKKLPISQPVQRTGEGTDFPLTIFVWKIARGQSVDSPVPFGELGRHQEARRMRTDVKKIGIIMPSSAKGPNIPIHLLRWDGRTRCGKRIPSNHLEVEAEGVQEFDSTISYEQRRPDHYYLCGTCAVGHVYRH